MNPCKNAQMPTRNVLNLLKTCGLYYKFCSIAIVKTLDFKHFGGKIHENFSDVALAHCNEDHETGYKRVTYPY